MSGYLDLHDPSFSSIDEASETGHLLLRTALKGFKMTLEFITELLQLLLAALQVLNLHQLGQLSLHLIDSLRGLAHPPPVLPNLHH